MNPSPHPGWARTAGILLAMFLASLGIDFLFNAGILAHFYLHPGPAMLPVRLLMRRIPFGYASILITVAFELWLIYRLAVRGALAGAKFGAIIGFVIGAAGALGLFSVLPLGVDYLVGMAICQIVEYSITGAIGSSGLESGRVFKAITIGFAILIAGVAAGLAMQAASTGMLTPS